MPSATVPEVGRRQVAVAQVAHDLRLAGREHALGDFEARVPRLAGQCDAAARASQRELEDALRVGQHDESALGTGHLDRRVQHEREHLVQHVAGTERPQAFEQRGHLPQVLDGRVRGATATRWRRGADLVDEKQQFRAAAAAQANAIAVGQWLLDDGLVVDEGPVA